MKKVETLNQAIKHIQHLEKIISSENQKNKKLNSSNKWLHKELSKAKEELSWLDRPEKRKPVKESTMNSIRKQLMR